jgi:glycosyltransferase involved in cell wall biosynthesis
MHIGIFAERFVGRYGADRVLVILAEQLRRAGHLVTLVGVRFSRAVVGLFPGQTLRVPDFSAKAGEARTLAWFEDKQYYLKRKLPRFDACVVGSYPWITAIPYLRTLARQVVFIDFGVVPTGGYPPDLVRLIEGVRANRRANLRHATEIVAISEFIAQDQARPDCQNQVPVHTLLLGADHLVNRLGYTEEDAPRPARPPRAEKKSHAVETLEGLSEQGRPLVLALGRWEPGCYKNSAAAFDVLRSLLDYEPGAVLVVMADPAHFRADPGLAFSVCCVGLPSDGELLEIKRLIDAGLSVSLWEGFNLPLAEMQYEDKPAFALNLAAHPEVVVSPEQLCADAEDMAAKLARALRAREAPPWAASGAADAWRARFCWRRFMDEFSRVVGRAA